MAMLCCFACRSTPTIFISASFARAFLFGSHKSLLGSSRGRRTYVITHRRLHPQAITLITGHVASISVFDATLDVRHGLSSTTYASAAMNEQGLFEPLIRFPHF